MRYVRILIIIPYFLAVSCVSFKVVSHVNESADFSKFHTFKMVNEIERTGNQGEYAGLEDLDRAIAKQMTDRKYVETPDADLGVHYRIILDREVNYQIDPLSYPSYSSGYAYVRAKRYTEGILIIEMRDRDNRKVVWQASLDLRINKRKKQENVIYDTVNLIFQDYPFIAGEKEPANLPDKNK